LLQARTQTHSGVNDWANLSILLILGAALLGRIGLNLTPCVLPMIPVNLAILGASGGSWKNGMARAAVYGAGMAAAYGILGTTVVLTGARFGELNASPWFNFSVAGIFLVLSLAMFDRFSIDFSRWGGNWNPVQKGGRWIGSFLLGALAALLAGACVAPVLIAVILFAADLYAKGNSAGLLLPFVLGIGMALPWPLAGAGMAVLPKPGAWMNRIKICFGIIILAAAAWYGYLGYTLLPGAYDRDAEFARLEEALAQSKKENRPILLDFHASWCKNCKEMERSVLPDPQVQQALKAFLVVPFQAEQPSDPKVAALLNRFGFRGLPAFAIIQPE
ncbi:MAG: thioredoxin family protein, partial [Lentisphaeria bacterium]|nr:thioredoxin family protein [Lentisphaeria bacterium]